MQGGTAILTRCAQPATGFLLSCPTLPNDTDTARPRQLPSAVEPASSSTPNDSLTMDSNNAVAKERRLRASGNWMRGSLQSMINYILVTESVLAPVNKAALRDGVKISSGHLEFKPDAYLDRGVPAGLMQTPLLDPTDRSARPRCTRLAEPLRSFLHGIRDMLSLFPGQGGNTILIDTTDIHLDIEVLLCCGIFSSLRHLTRLTMDSRLSPREPGGRETLRGGSYEESSPSLSSLRGSSHCAATDDDSTVLWSCWRGRTPQSYQRGRT